MAQESFRNPAPQDQATFFEYPDARAQPQGGYQAGYTPSYAGQQLPESEWTRQNAPTYGEGYVPEARLQQAQQPINDAVASAFDKANTSSHIPPDLISQITQNVIQQLKATSLDAQMPPIQQTHSLPQSHPSLPNAPPIGSFSNHSASPPPIINRTEVYTPPSPQRPEEPMPGSPPPQSKYAPTTHESPQETSMPTMNERRPASPFSQASDTGARDARPMAPPRLSTGNEETTLEKIWGPLFDQEGTPTRRLGQFLRGIAVHLIEDYEPTQSLVITPSKMQKFYEDTKLSTENYPWDLVFDDRTSSISRLYREVECQHHLVQEENRFIERPDIPGLTPIGFERWATMLIQANPDAEYERLRKAVLDMPISNPDDKKERFPKEISRRLFPKGQDQQVKSRLESALVQHCGIDLPKNANFEQPSSPRMTTRQESIINNGSSIPAPPQTTPLPMSNSIERERQPYSGTPIDNPSDLPPLSQPIERERKPYSSQPGGGKTYDDGPKPFQARVGRSDSMASKARPIPINVPTQRQTHDLPIPEPGHHRTSSTINPPGVSRRQRSPSMTAGGDFRRSEGDFFSSSYGGSYGNMPGDPTDEESRRYYREREPSVRDDGRGYDGTRERGRYDRANDHGTVPPRASYANEDEYYRSGGRVPGNGYDYAQPYPPSYR